MSRKNCFAVCYLLVIFILAGCGGKELPGGTGFESETGGSCDDGDATNGPPTNYSTPALYCRDNPTWATSVPLTFQDVTGTTDALSGPHATQLAHAASNTKAKSTWQVTRKENVSCEITTHIFGYMTGGKADVRAFVWVFDSNGQEIGHGTQFVYGLVMNPQDPTKKIDVSLNGQPKATISNPGIITDTQNEWTLNLQPGAYKVQLEVTVRADADGLAKIQATSSARFK